ncbi:hypothetical protein RUM44_007612 [Polyplax serrata]|uniref:Uncharacterized protein n=1 Tax=Polyplax serrata TaxID=468196 RepID=A0ABR1BAW2_POLSC
MASCPFRRQKSNNRLVDGSPVRQESLGVAEDEDEGPTLNLKVLHEAIRLLLQPRLKIRYTVKLLLKINFNLKIVGWILKGFIRAVGPDPNSNDRGLLSRTFDSSKSRKHP